MFSRVLVIADKEEEMERLRLVIDFPAPVADGIKRYSADDKSEFYKAFVIDCVKQTISNRDGKLRRRKGAQGVLD